MDSDYYSSMTCTVQYTQEDDGFASTEQVFVDAYHMKESDAWKADPANESTVFGWNEAGQVENSLWVTVAEGDQDSDEW